MTRPGGRALNELREISITSGVNPHAEGSCLIKFGRTEVLCTASVLPKVPAWLKGSGKGWVSAEYGMLPRATGSRKDREAIKGRQEGRTVEIQRLIGRSLRAVCDLSVLNNHAIWLDCDVIVADGGTRTASITGAYVALALAIQHLEKQKLIRSGALTDHLAAVSCGVTSAGVVLDMDYDEDSAAHADGNFVLSGKGNWIELQTSSEARPISQNEFEQMQILARQGVAQLIELQKNILQAQK